MSKYRIKKTTYKSGRTIYRVQRTFLYVLWVNTSSYPITSFGCSYPDIGVKHDSLNDAKKEIRQQIKWDINDAKVSSDIITWE